ncbi:MAG: hypothetical protein HY885_01990 [Deltaproteobacteria bacterium]|nr:hypothetical protein [Deltaproteobacteria bacterium]
MRTYSKDMNQKTNLWGGSAAGGGLNFQSCVSAIAAVHMARGTPILWLKDVAVDIPTSLSAETGGPGDDIRVEFQDGSLAEIQAKKGIRKGYKLWDSLLKLAMGLDSGEISYGVLAVCPNTSKKTLCCNDDTFRSILDVGRNPAVWGANAKG